MHATTFLSAAVLSGLASAATVRVQVGPGLTYSPRSITAARGDTVIFNLVNTNHDVVQGAFDTPCQPSATGFNSGFPSSTGQSFTVTINDTNPVYYYCSARGHCQGGMVATINAPTTGNTADAYAQRATTAGSSSAPANVRGGVLGVAAAGTPGSALTPTPGGLNPAATGAGVSGASSGMNAREGAQVLAMITGVVVLASSGFFWVF